MQLKTHDGSDARFLATALLLGSMGLTASARSQGQRSPVPAPECRVQAVDYEGWQAQQISNRWVRLIIVPQIGGRLMQVTFAGHDYLFVNSQLAGKYFPPNPGKWFNYGGDKI